MVYNPPINTEHFCSVFIVKYACTQNTQSTYAMRDALMKLLRTNNTLLRQILEN